MNDAPRISILLPARNAEACIEEALRSLSGQTIADWECIVVDDASSDRTPAAIAQWAAADPRFRSIRLRSHRGIVFALNRAAEEARAPCLARQDADDRSLPERLARSLALLESDARLGAVATGVRFVPAPQPGSGWEAYACWLNAARSAEEIEREIWIESPLPHPAVIMRRKAFDQAGGYREVPWPEDYDLWLRMRAKKWRFAKTPEILYEWALHEERLTLTDSRYLPAEFLACKLHHLRMRLRKRPVFIWGAGRDGRRLARALIARRIDLRGFIDIDPRKIGRARLGKPVIGADDALGSLRPPDALDGLRPGDALLLVAVGTRGARELIRARLAGKGWREPEDFLCLH